MHQSSFVSTLLVAASAFMMAGVDAASFAPQINVCQKDTLPSGWVAGQTSAKLVQVASFQVLNPSNAIQCSGTVVIVDGCSFKVVNFTFGGALQTKWYGGVVGLDSNGQVAVNQNGVKMVELDVAPSNTATVQYNLITNPSTAYSFLSVNQLRLFDVAENELLCTADLPYQNPLASGATTATITTGGLGGSATGSAAGGASGTVTVTQTSKSSAGTPVIAQGAGWGVTAILSGVAAVAAMFAF